MMDSKGGAFLPLQASMMDSKGGGDDPSSTSAAFSQWSSVLYDLLNHTPWMAIAALAISVYHIYGFYPISYALGIGILSLFGILSLLIDFLFTSYGPQYLLDGSTLEVLIRWVGFATCAFLYVIRVYLLHGFYLVSCGLGMYIFKHLMVFLSPQVDPEIPVDGPNEFVRHLPELKFWHSITNALCIASALTCFSIFDDPEFWPLLLINWLILFIGTIRIWMRMKHKINYKYIPFSLGKQGLLVDTMELDNESDAVSVSGVFLI